MNTWSQWRHFHAYYNDPLKLRLERFKQWRRAKVIVTIIGRENIGKDDENFKIVRRQESFNLSSACLNDTLENLLSVDRFHIRERQLGGSKVPSFI